MDVSPAVTVCPPDFTLSHSSFIFILTLNFANRFSSKYFLSINVFFVAVASVVFHCVQYKKRDLKKIENTIFIEFQRILAVTVLCSH